MFCPECLIGELENNGDALECADCGALFDMDYDDPDDLDPIENDELE